MLNGIAKRMVLLGYLYSEDFPEDELPRVRVEAISSVETFESFDIRYGADQVYGFRVDRWQEPSKVKEEVTELRNNVRNRKEFAAKRINECLSRTIETVGIELKLFDASGIGWPIAMAAAAWLADTSNGLVQADDVGWLEPTDVEVRTILEE